MSSKVSFWWSQSSVINLNVYSQKYKLRSHSVTVSYLKIFLLVFLQASPGGYFSSLPRSVFFPWTHAPPKLHTRHLVCPPIHAVHQQRYTSASGFSVVMTHNYHLYLLSLLSLVFSNEWVQSSTDLISSKTELKRNHCIWNTFIINELTFVLFLDPITIHTWDTVRQFLSFVLSLNVEKLIK